MSASKIAAPFPVSEMTQMRTAIVSYVMDDLESIVTERTEAIKAHDSKEYFIFCKTVFNMVGDLGYPKDKVIFILMGQNKLRTHWGSMMDDFGLEPACTQIQDLIQHRMPGLLQQMGFKSNVWLQDVDFVQKSVKKLDGFIPDGNYKLRILLGLGPAEDETEEVQQLSPTPVTLPESKDVPALPAKATWAAKARQRSSSVASGTSASSCISMSVSELMASARASPVTLPTKVETPGFKKFTPMVETIPENQKLVNKVEKMEAMMSKMYEIMMDMYTKTSLAEKVDNPMDLLGPLEKMEGKWGDFGQSPAPLSRSATPASSS